MCLSHERCISDHIKFLKIEKVLVFEIFANLSLPHLYPFSHSFHLYILTVGSPWWLMRTSFTRPPGSKIISMRNISLLMMALFSVPVGGVNDRSTRRDVVSRRSNRVCWLTTKSTSYSPLVQIVGKKKTILWFTAIPN